MAFGQHYIDATQLQLRLLEEMDNFSALQEELGAGNGFFELFMECEAHALRVVSAVARRSRAHPVQVHWVALLGDVMEREVRYQHFHDGNAPAGSWGQEDCTGWLRQMKIGPRCDGTLHSKGWSVGTLMRLVNHAAEIERFSWKMLVSWSDTWLGWGSAVVDDRWVDPWLTPVQAFFEIQEATWQIAVLTEINKDNPGALAHGGIFSIQLMLDDGIPPAGGVRWAMLFTVDSFLRLQQDRLQEMRQIPI